MFDFVLKNAKMKHGKKKKYYSLKECCQAKIIGVQTISLENGQRRSLSREKNCNKQKTSSLFSNILSVSNPNTTFL